MQRVFGVGWAKTGTTTLAECLRTLGYDHQSQRLDLVDHLKDGDLEPILAIARSKESFEDWPWLLLWREFDREFPGSRFVLTIRPEDAWLASYRNMLANQNDVRPGRTERRRILYDLPFPDVTDEQLVGRYRRHNAEVQDWFAGRDDLLVVDWSAGDGWEELCGFLGRPVPDVEFPHANRGRYDSTATRAMRRIRRRANETLRAWGVR